MQKVLQYNPTGGRTHDPNLSFEQGIRVLRGKSIFIEYFDTGMEFFDFSSAGRYRIGVQLGADGTLYVQYAGNPPGGARATVESYYGFDNQGSAALSTLHHNNNKTFYRADFVKEPYEVYPGTSQTLHLETYNKKVTKIDFSEAGGARIDVQRSAQDPDKVYFQYQNFGQQPAFIEVNVK